MTVKDEYEAQIEELKVMYQQYYEIKMKIRDLEDSIKDKKAKIPKKMLQRDQLYLNLCKMLLTSRNVIESQRTLIENKSKQQ